MASKPRSMLSSMVICLPNEFILRAEGSIAFFTALVATIREEQEDGLAIDEDLQVDANRLRLSGGGGGQVTLDVGAMEEMNERANRVTFRFFAS
jgi:hypothetical protein